MTGAVAVGNGTRLERHGRVGFPALVLLSLGVAGYAVVVYGLLPLGAAVHPDMRPIFVAHHRFWIYSHVFASAFALALGPWQFANRLRSSHPAVHRWSGRVYLALGVLVGGLAGLFVAFGAYGGPVARLGFVSLSVAWLFTGFKAYRAVRSRDFVSHRRWMVRNFALTFAAVTLRLWLPGMVLSGIPIEAAYPVVAWLCWIPNVIIAEWLFNRARRVPPTLAAGRG